jgi:hypothetical protein
LKLIIAVAQDIRDRAERFRATLGTQTAKILRSESGRLIENLKGRYRNGDALFFFWPNKTKYCERKGEKYLEGLCMKRLLSLIHTVPLAR